MSRIDDMIRDLCPDGVEYQELGEIARYSPDRVSSLELSVETYVGVDNLLPNKAGRVDATYLASTETVTGFQAGDVLLGNIRPYLRKVWLADRSGGCSGDVLVVRIKDDFQHVVDPSFLYYVLSSESFFRYDQGHARGAGMPRGNKKAILKYPIQVPPLGVQREIVRVLDQFTRLEAELEAELEARRQQYAYYRGVALAFGDKKVRNNTLGDEDKGGYWTTLGQVCRNVNSGATPRAGLARYYENGTVPWLRTNEVRFVDIHDTAVKITEAAITETAAKVIPTNCVIIAISGATAGRSAINKIPLATNQHCLNLEIDESIALYRYVYYWVSHNYVKLKSLGRGARSDLNGTIIKNFPICLPTLRGQRHIADVLDRFDALVNDLSAGLPAEIAARRQQYEYYRDRLLTFPEKR